jgi:hypothetical protein
VIEVRSGRGQGATFSVFLPALSPSLAPGAKAAKKKTGDDKDVTTTQPIVGFRADAKAKAPATS